MKVKLHVKKGDQVMVTTGRNKGKTGTISSVLVKENKVVIAGVNMVKRHMRPSAAHPEGVFEKELPIHVSNVAHVDPSTGKPGKVGVRISEGKKIRYFKKSDTNLSN